MARLYHPDADAFVAAGVDIARIEDGALLIGGMKRANVAMAHPMLAADEHFPKGPFVTGGRACGVLGTHCAATFLALRFAAWARKASRTHAPSFQAFCRAVMRSVLQGPLPLITS